MEKKLQLRRFQNELKSKLTQLVIDSSGGPLSQKCILANITCGGGKSILPLIALQVLHEANLVDQLLTIVSRENLSNQCSEGFEDPFFKTLLRHKYSINEATNDVNPCRGTNGWVTTYQAIGADRAGINYFEMKRARTLLCLDECHHVAHGSNWHHQLKPLFKEAVFVLLMSGTLERHDGKKIAFLPYREINNAL